MYGQTVFERFTDRARRAVVLAQEEARLLNHSYIGTEHFLLGLMSEEEGAAATTLAGFGVDITTLRERVREVIGTGTETSADHLPFTPRAKKVLEMSVREARRLGHNDISTEHLLLGLLREGEGVASQILGQMGIDIERTREALGQTSASAPAMAESPRRRWPQAQYRCPHPDEQLIVTRLDAGIRTVRCRRCGQLVATFPDS